MSQYFDNERFSADIAAKTFHERIGNNELGREIGLSASTICRVVTQRKDPSVDSLAVLLTWLGKKFEDYVI